MTWLPALLVLLLLLGLPLGFAITSGLLPARSRVGRIGTAALAGIGPPAAVAHALVSLGVTGRIAVPLACGAAVVAGTYALVARRRRTPFAPVDPATPRPRAAALLVREALPLALVALVLFQPVHDSLSFGLTAHDATRIWAPKAARALDEAPPDLTDERAHAHPEYPRGLGLMTAAAAWPLDELDPRLVRLVPLFLFALALLCAFDALSCRGRTAAGFAVIAILGSVPFLVRLASSGLADVPLAAFVLLGVVGVSPQRDGRIATATAVAGALGAMVVKDEGLAFCAGLVAVAAFRLARAGLAWRALGVVAAVAALAAPWVALRAGPRVGPPILHGSLVENLGLLMLRADAMLREIGHLVLGFPDPSPGGFGFTEYAPGGEPVLHVALASGVVLLVGRGGRIAILPVGLLLLADFAAILLSDPPVDWQVVTALPRLVVHCLPALVVAAAGKLTGGPSFPEAAATAAEARAAGAA